MLIPDSGAQRHSMAAAYGAVDGNGVALVGDDMQNCKTLLAMSFFQLSVAICSYLHVL